MPAPLKISIDINKLRRSWMKDHQNGARYCELIVYFNDEPDKYGNTVSVKQGIPKEAREAGEKAGYCGNGKPMERGGSQPPQARQSASKRNWREGVPSSAPPKTDDLDESEIPF
jgi:hypothetical protein